MASRDRPFLPADSCEALAEIGFDAEWESIPAGRMIFVSPEFHADSPQELKDHITKKMSEAREAGHYGYYLSVERRIVITPYKLSVLGGIPLNLENENAN